MPIDKLAPASGAHSVQTAVFAIEWSSPLPISAITALRAAYETSELLRSQFPTPPQEQKQLSIRVESGGANPATGHSELGGYLFSRPGNGVGPNRALQCVREQCLFIANDYTRWKFVLKDVLDTFSEIKGTLISAPINAIGLQYTDVFHWRGEPGELNMAEVFSSDSGLLPTSALTLKGLWHSHHGCLQPESEDSGNQILDNVNIDVGDNQGQRTIAITTSHRRLLGSPITDAAAFDEHVKASFELLHERNKDVLRKLLHTDVKSKISLAEA